ncbi:PIN domain-containing protein [Gottfriedia acidiceleris]|uniref:PIN domain-containing protein n=1 Tax=Gottfriedia acidiceleris TaxID=371036 RepID=UPI002FFD90FE
MIFNDFFQKILQENLKYLAFMDNEYSKRNRKEVEITTDDRSIVTSIKREKEIYICLDTCTWINVVEKGNLKVLVDLWDLNYQQDAKLLVPEQVRIEWDRNKNSAINEKEMNKLKDIINKTKSFNEILVEEGEKKEELNKLIRNIESEYLVEVEEINNNYINFADEIMDIGRKISTTEQVKLKSVDLALEKLPPFHSGKNSIGDAIIFNSLIEYLENFNNPVLYFITDNKTDFSESKEKPQNLHPILNQLAQDKGVEIRYSLDLKKSIENIVNEVTDLEYVEEYKAKFTDEFEINYLNRCEECDGKMEMKLKRFDGRGQKVYYECSNCSHIKETHEYQHDRIHDAFY